MKGKKWSGYARLGGAIYTHTHTHTQKHTRVRMCTYTHTYACTHTCAYTHTNTHIHIMSSWNQEYEDLQLAHWYKMCLKLWSRLCAKMKSKQVTKVPTNERIKILRASHKTTFFYFVFCGLVAIIKVCNLLYNMKALATHFDFISTTVYLYCFGLGYIAGLGSNTWGSI